MAMDAASPLSPAPTTITSSRMGETGCCGLSMINAQGETLGQGCGWMFLVQPQVRGRRRCEQGKAKKPSCGVQ